jgi:hypothetical protein
MAVSGSVNDEAARTTTECRVGALPAAPPVELHAATPALAEMASANAATVGNGSRA